MPSPLTLEWEIDIEPRSGTVKGPTWNDVESIVKHFAHAGEGFIILKRSDSEFVQMTWRDADPDEGLQVEWRGASDEHVELDEGFIAVERAVAVFKQFFDDASRMAHVGAWVPLVF